MKFYLGEEVPIKFGIIYLLTNSIKSLGHEAVPKQSKGKEMLINKRIVYRSKPTYWGCDPHVLDIFKTGTRNNKGANIRSTLWLGKASLFQILEGEEEKVEQTFHRISRDSRHYDVNLLGSTKIEFNVLPGIPFDIHFNRSNEAIDSLSDFFSTEVESSRLEHLCALIRAA